MPTAVPITAPPMRAADPAAGLIRRIVVLATASFVVGFVGFLALDVVQPSAPPMPEQTAAMAEPAADVPAPAALPTSDDWNIPKKI